MLRIAKEKRNSVLRASQESSNSQNGLIRNRRGESLSSATSSVVRNQQKLISIQDSVSQSMVTFKTNFRELSQLKSPCAANFYRFNNSAAVSRRENAKWKTDSAVDSVIRYGNFPSLSIFHPCHQTCVYKSH